MKERQIKQDVTYLPKADLPGVWGGLLRFIARVRPVYWLILAIFAFAAGSIFLPGALWTTLWAAIKARKFIVSMLTAFSLLAISLVWTAGQRIDIWVLKLINERGQRPKWLDWFMLAATQLGNGLFAYVAALILFLRGQRLFAYELVFGILTLWLIVELLKMLVKRPRPYSKLTEIRIIGSRAGGHSFPSGHTSQAFFFASLTAHFYTAGMGIAFLLYAAASVVGVTRVYLGMHYPRDVLGGAVLGTVWGLIGVTINSYIFGRLSIY